MLNRIEYENFKCFTKNEFEIKKLTLLTGANSSGKSSLLYGFLGAIQSGEFPFHFSPNGKYVNMGDFNELSHLHDSKKEIKLAFNFTAFNGSDFNIETYWKEDKIRKVPTLSRLRIANDYGEVRITKKIKYTLEFDYNEAKHKNDDSFNAEFTLQLNSLLINVFEKSSKNEEKNIEDDLKKQFLLTKKKINDKRSFIKFTFKDFDELSKFSLEKGNYILQSFLRNITGFLKSMDKKINFISSFRLYPERTYYEKSKSDLKIGKFGENYEDQIIAWETKDSAEFKELISILRKIKLLESVESRRLEGGRYEVLVRVKAKGVKASLNDVGFGISQFLPIIVSDIQLGKRSTLCIAQPEIHLHPSIQASFGDYLVENINNKEKRYLVETHSEYILNRIRLSIVKKEIKKEDIKVYYLNNNGSKVVVHDLIFTEKGEIQNAPKDFFETYMMDVIDIANNIE